MSSWPGMSASATIASRRAIAEAEGCCDASGTRAVAEGAVDTARIDQVLRAAVHRDQRREMRQVPSSPMVGNTPTPLPDSRMLRARTTARVSASIRCSPSPSPNSSRRCATRSRNSEAQHAPVARLDEAAEPVGRVAEIDVAREPAAGEALELEVVRAQAMPLAHAEQQLDAALVRDIVEAEVLLAVERRAERTGVRIEAAIGADRRLVGGTQREVMVIASAGGGVTGGAQRARLPSRRRGCAQAQQLNAIRIGIGNSSGKRCDDPTWPGSVPASPVQTVDSIPGFQRVCVDAVLRWGWIRTSRKERAVSSGSPSGRDASLQLDRAVPGADAPPGSLKRPHARRRKGQTQPPRGNASRGSPLAGVEERLPALTQDQRSACLGIPLPAVQQFDGEAAWPSTGSDYPVSA
ncbi:MAG: hypothetical protein U1F11_05105 [Steroidobacteraceae bacterium]